MTDDPKRRITTGFMICMIGLCLLNLAWDAYILKWSRGIIWLEGVISAIILIAIFDKWSDDREKINQQQPHEKEPNQAPEPTSTAVTPPAVAGDRASGTRGSS